jgi:hypothetical protein
MAQRLRAKAGEKEGNPTQAATIYLLFRRDALICFRDGKPSFSGRGGT